MFSGARLSAREVIRFSGSGCRLWRVVVVAPKDNRVAPDHVEVVHAELAEFTNVLFDAISAQSYITEVMGQP